MNKKTNLLFILTLSLLGMVGCSNVSSSTSSTGSNGALDPNDPDYYSKISERAIFDLESDKSFVEEFDNGMDDDTWYALDGAWHTDSQGWEHGGMKSRNLFYTRDNSGKSYLAIKARGWYNTEDENTKHKPEGGCLISKNHLGPGRYEITMAPMPREGAVSTMWTYCTTTGSEYTSQNEIDIELGGSSNSGTHFEEYWATSWTKKTNKETDKVPVSSNDKLGFYMNDGKMHTYTFDWYTEYPNAEDPRVDWFVDGVFVNSITGSMVPDTEMPLWVGVWFPPAWCGNPTFIEDYMIVDKVSYQAFSEADQYVNSCRAEAGYTKTVPSELNIQTIAYDKVTRVNKLSNGDFTYIEKCPKDNSYYGWLVDEDYSKGTVQFGNQNDPSITLVAGEDDGSTTHGEYIMQKITDAYSGFKYSFKIKAKLNSETSVGNIEIASINKSNKKTKMKVIKVESTVEKEYTFDIVMPEKAIALQIDLTSENGSVTYSNSSLVFEK